MSADVNTFVDKIIADAEQKVRTDLKTVSSMVKRDFIEKAKEAVLMYYSNYYPHVYTRINNLKNNVIDDDCSFDTLNGNGYGAWIQFNSDGMSNYDIGSKDAVVSNFMYGIHGKRSIFVEDNPAISFMDNFQNNYKATLDGYFMNLGYTIK
jgi:hypothetical protein